MTEAIRHHAADRATPGSLADVEVVITDSRHALAVAYERGLARTAEVRSSSPSLILDTLIAARPIDGRVVGGDLRREYLQIVDWAWAIFRACANEAQWRELAPVAARTVYFLQGHIFKFSMLSDGDLARPIALVEPAPTDSAAAAMNTPWQAMLGSNPYFVHIQTPSVPETIASPPDPSWRERLRFADPQTMAYRVALSMWERLPARSPRGTILILNEDDLQKEACLHLARRGFGLRRLRQPPRTGATGRDMGGLHALAADVLRPLAASLCDRSVARALVDYVATAIASDAQSYQSHKDAWGAQLDRMAGLKPRAVVANKLRSVSGAALCAACRDRDLLTVAFQHGAGREFSELVDRFGPNLETVDADVLFTFSPEAAQITNASDVTRGTAIPVGMERSYRRMGAMRPDKAGVPPVWYVSTALYINNVPGMSKGMTDWATARLELRVIDEVLAGLPHRVLYKPYPWMRYPDSDPVVERAKQVTNLEVYEGRKDLRYLIGNSRVLVTSRTTSTLGWCLGSGRPVVYIDIPQMGLPAAARAPIEAGLFLFDGAKPDVWQSLREFLSQPLADIERMWAQRQQARKAMMQQFFDVGGWRAGARAADIMIKARFQPSRFRKAIQAQ